MSNNTRRRSMIMIPNQRNLSAVVVFEGVFPNNSSVRATKIIFRGPATEIIVFAYFEFFLRCFYLSRQRMDLVLGLELRLLV